MYCRKETELEFYQNKAKALEFKDPRILPCCEDLIEDMLNDNIKVVSHKQSKVNTFIELLKIGFLDINLDNLTSLYLYETFKDVEIKFTPHILGRFILMMDKHGVLFQEDMKKVAALGDFLTNRIKKELFYQMLQDPIKEKYILCINKDNHWVHTFIDADDVELINAIKKFIENKKIRDDYQQFFENFSTGLSDKSKATLYGLNFNTMMEQAKHFSNCGLEKRRADNIVGTIDTFYYFIGANYNPEIFKDVGLDIVNIRSVGFVKTIMRGYDIVHYNPIDSVPKSDKWLLIYSSENLVNSDITTTFTREFDFTSIKNKTYREWLKEYTWKTNNSIKNKNMKVYLISDFLNYISDLKAGNVLSIYSKKSSDTTITVNDIMAYKAYFYSTGRSSDGRTFTDVRNFLQFIDNLGLVNIESGVLYLLFAKTDRKTDKNSIPDDELKKIAKLMSEKSEDSDVAKLYYLIFYIALETEFRVTNILTLKTDSVKETAKPNEYVLVSPTKISNKEELEQPITIYTKKHIDEVVKTTDKYRDETCPDELRDYIFVYKTSRNNYHLIDSTEFNEYLQSCCSELGLQNYSFGNLRDTHMTKAEEYVIRNQLSDMQQGVLSGHRTTETDHKHYVDTDIRTLLEAVHGIIIGNVDINGQIIDENSDVVKEENSVSNGCGYCNSDVCNEHTMLDCLMCKSFVTTISRLPYFEESVKMLDHRIENAVIAHDKEDLVNIKRLYVGFMNEILKLKERSGKNV